MNPGFVNLFFGHVDAVNLSQGQVGESGFHKHVGILFGFLLHVPAEAFIMIAE